jgi:hypothetical protein
MAKPKGGTLTRLFEVSERERQEFYENIQKKIQHIAVDPGIPETGTPEQGTPEGGIPEAGIPEAATPIRGIPERPTVEDKAAPHLFIPSEQRPQSTTTAGIPVSGIPVSDTFQTGIPTTGMPASGVALPSVVHALPRVKVRRALQVQDGHSLGEQLVLTTLWNGAAPVEGQNYRRITIGYRTLSGMCGLTVNNCKANLKSLQAKLAIEPETSYSNTMATTYRVFGFADILRRRETAGLTHVVRSKGAQFVNPETGIPLMGIPGVPVPGTPDTQTGVPGAGEKGIPAPGTQLRIKKEAHSKEHPSAHVGVVSAAIRKHIIIDDDAVAQIVAGCLEQDSHATADEIAHFALLKIHQHRKNPSVQNLAGLLIRSVRDYFQTGSGELQDFRSAKVQENAGAREVAQQILDDPQSEEKDRQWAIELLASSSSNPPTT